MMSRSRSQGTEITIVTGAFYFKQRRSRQVIGSWQHGVHMRSSLTSMSASCGHWNVLLLSAGASADLSEQTQGEL